MNFEEFLRDNKTFSLETARKCGVSRAIVAYHLKHGNIIRVARGVYAERGVTFESENTELETLSRCGYEFTAALFSALRIHGFTTANPTETWIALPQKSRRPKKIDFPLRVVWLNEKSYNHGVQIVQSGGVSFKVYTPAKTVADLFKFRNKFGIDIAIEALKEGWQKKLFTSDELYRAAKECRVSRVIGPYSESIMS